MKAIEHLVEKEVAARTTSLSESLALARGQILILQDSVDALKAENLSLKKENIRLNDWPDAKQEYQLFEVAPSSFVRRYRLVDKANPLIDLEASPSHDLCANCFDNNKRSILQAFEYQGHRLYSKKCFSCGLVVYVDKPPKSTIDFF